MPAPQTWNDITAWLAENEKAAGSLPEGGTKGESADDGPRGSENCRDVKKNVGGNSVDGAGKANATGRADNMASMTGLKQTTVGKMPEVERAVKVVEEESDKMAAANLDDDAQLASAHAALLKAAAELPVILAKAGVPAARGTKAAAAPAAEKSATEKAMAATVDSYRKYGEDHADLTVNYLRGFWDVVNTLKSAADAGTLEQMLAGGGEAGPGAGPEEMAGMPTGPGDVAGAVPPPAAGPGEHAEPDADDQGGAPPGAGPGEPDTDDLAAAAAELGMSPDELMQLIELLKTKAQAEPMGPADKAAVERVLTKAASVASDIKQRMRSGKFQLKPAADGTPERARRNAAASYFNELLRAAG